MNPNTMLPEKNAFHVNGNPKQGTRKQSGGKRLQKCRKPLPSWGSAPIPGIKQPVPQPPLAELDGGARSFAGDRTTELLCGMGVARPQNTVLGTWCMIRTYLPVSDTPYIRDCCLLLPPCFRIVGYQLLDTTKTAHTQTAIGFKWFGGL